MVAVQYGAGSLHRRASVGKVDDFMLRAAAEAAAVAVREPTTRIDWAELLKRVQDVDALACPCGGRLKFIALILEEDPARAILESLHLPSEPPPIARARSPDWLEPTPLDT
jgi:hypothetical protein